MESNQDTVVMPRKLTAENGAKAALMGEVKIEIRNPMYCECGECEICDLDPENDEQPKLHVYISWSDIKRIYDKIVEEMEVKNGE